MQREVAGGKDAVEEPAATRPGGGGQHTQAGSPSPVARLWNRQVTHYPANGPRTLYLAITVLATVILYYELYIQGAVATNIITDYGMTFTYFVLISIVGNAIGAFASLLAGLADRWGRANLVAYGLLITGLLIAFGLPNASSKLTYLIMFAAVSFVEGVVLVATPALIRDFSPQVGRGAAMGFWTLGPVLGSLVVTIVSSHTLGSHPDWQFQFYVCGIAGLVVFVIALFGLRELSPRIRDQLMVSMRDKALIEARAAGIDPKTAMSGHWRQMIRPDIIGSAFAISVFLLFYYIAVGFFVVYYATVFGYSPQRANGLANWYWATNAITLVATGLISDKVRVRKPFMVLGAVISLVGVALFARAATHPETSYYTFAFYLILGSLGGGMAYCAWMASFTETVEKHNPAATATGLAVWGWTIRAVITISLAIFTLVVPATSTLVDKGTHVQEIVAAHPKAVAVLSALDPATSAALGKNPADPVALPKALGEVAVQQGASPAKAAQVQTAAARRLPEIATANAIDPTTLAGLTQSPTQPLITKATGEIAAAFKISPAEALGRLAKLADPATKADLTLITPYGNALTGANAAIPAKDLQYLSANAAQVQKAQKQNPKQWQHWWWVCFGAQVVFLPFIFLMTGRWSPRKAREDELEHERLVEREMAALESEPQRA